MHFMKLRIFVPAAERPGPSQRLAWMLFDARGELRRDGNSTFAEMPGAAEIEAILPVERVLFARLKLPRVSAATIRELLPFAVEDRLVADPAHIHAVAGGKNAAGETLVAVVDREWLRAWLDAMEQAGHRVTAAYCESTLLAGGKDDWHVVLGKSRGMLVDDEGAGASFDRGPDLPLAVRVALDEASARNARPSSVRVHYEAGETLPDLAHWSSEAGVPFSAGTAWEQLVQGQPAPGTIDLLQGDLARRRTTARIPRAAAWLGVVIVAAQLAFSAFDAWRLTSERNRLESRREAIFREAFPEAKAVVDPDLQMARNLDEMKRARGLAAGDDFLAQLTRVAREGRAPVKAVEYSGGRVVAR
jgi:general secretion pathway protein L